MSRSLLLVDTMANGTFIDYTPNYRAMIHKDWASTCTLVNGGSYSGDLTQDVMCLDDDEDICIENFSFYHITGNTNLKVSKIDYKGVIPFNKYGSVLYPNQRLVNILDYEDIFSNSTM